MLSVLTREGCETHELIAKMGGCRMSSRPESVCEFVSLRAWSSRTMGISST